MLTARRNNSHYALPVRKYRRMRKPCRNYHHKITRRRNPPRQLTCMAQRCWNRTKLKPLAGTSKFPYTPLAELCCHLLWRGTWDARFLLLGNTPAILTICLSLFCIKSTFFRTTCHWSPLATGRRHWRTVGPTKHSCLHTWPLRCTSVMLRNTTATVSSLAGPEVDPLSPPPPQPLRHTTAAGQGCALCLVQWERWDELFLPPLGRSMGLRVHTWSPSTHLGQHSSPVWTQDYSFRTPLLPLRKHKCGPRALCTYHA